MITEGHAIEPGQSEAPVGEIRFLFLADHDLFARRGERFRNLSQGHPLGDYLNFLGSLADAQQEAWQHFPPLSLPDPKEQVLCREHGIPLLAAASWLRNPAWREGLTTILQKLAETPLPPAARETVTGLMQAGENKLEKTADMILAGELGAVSPRELPFVAAALQVYWARMATALGEQAFGRLEQGGLCPVCGSPPVVGIVGSSGGGEGLRYLCCSLCASQWHMVRLKCSSCESTQGINHYALEDSTGAIKAESCDACNSYLKLLYREHDSRVEPMADDLASLSLDLLMGEAGKVHGGVNLFCHPGEASG